MRRWFLSYNTHDLPLMQALEGAVRAKESDAHLFFAPKSLRAGGFWMPELAKAIREADVFVLLVGQNGIGPWQTLEYYEAFDRRANEPTFPVILLLLEGQSAPGLPFLRQLHWILTADPASEMSLAQLFAAADGSAAEAHDGLWKHTAPYRGLSAMAESDADFFFGRGRETVEALNALAHSPEKISVLLGNSGVGKSSLAQAGVLAALARQAWPAEAEEAGPWPQAFADSRNWCILKFAPGEEPMRALVEQFLRTWQLEATGPQRAELLALWVSKLVDGAVTLRDLLDATIHRYRDELRQPEPPAFLIYIDQGEELYLRAHAGQRSRFSEVLGVGLRDSRLRVIISLRADFFGEFQKDEPLFSAHRQVNVPPLREEELHKVVSSPVALLGARFEHENDAAFITHRVFEQSTRESGALPLLSYMLDDMWSRMVARGDGVLRLPSAAFDLSGVLVSRANAFLAKHASSETSLQRIFTIKLANVREDSEPTRRRALRSEFSDEEWKLASELADHPNRLLVISNAANGESQAEVAHEAIFRGWDTLREWIASAREFLVWRSSFESSLQGWKAAEGNAKTEALLMGKSLYDATSWLERRGADLRREDKQFIQASINLRKRSKRRWYYGIALLNVILIAAGYSQHPDVRSVVLDQYNWFVFGRPYMMNMVRPRVLSAQAEQALAPLGDFQECANCPKMIVIPAGKFLMGSPADEPDREDSEAEREVTIGRPFAVGQFPVTIAEYKACAAVGGCPAPRGDQWDDGKPPPPGENARPIVNVNWFEAKQYANWLSTMTGKEYRLLTEAEWEYAARGGRSPKTAYPWGREIGVLNANCRRDCGSVWDGQKTSPVGTFKKNDFELFDMAGNVFQWVEDCFAEGKTPVDGTPHLEKDCPNGLARGGSWYTFGVDLRSAYRFKNAFANLSDDLGFRVARTLSQPPNNQVRP